MNIIGTKWVFRNKVDESGVITRNKARLVALVARLEVVRLLLAFSSMSGLKLFQMDVKSAFLNIVINEEVFVSQPPGFVDHQHPKHV